MAAPALLRTESAGGMQEGEKVRLPFPETMSFRGEKNNRKRGRTHWVVQHRQDNVERLHALVLSQVEAQNAQNVSHGLTGDLLLPMTSTDVNGRGAREKVDSSSAPAGA